MTEISDGNGSNPQTDGRGLEWLTSVGPGRGRQGRNAPRIGRHITGDA